MPELQERFLKSHIENVNFLIFGVFNQKANTVFVFCLGVSVLSTQSAGLCSSSINADTVSYGANYKLGHLGRLFHIWSVSEVFIAPINQTLSKYSVPFMS